MSSANTLIDGIQIQRPPHDESPNALCPARVITTWPIGTFVENIAALPDGSFYVSVESLREIHLVSRDGFRCTFAAFDASVTGLAIIEEDVCVSTGTIGQPGWSVQRLDPSGTRVSEILVPDALFLNGSTLFSDNQILVADSILGRIYAVDLTSGDGRVWLDHDLFRKVSAEPMLPGVNGIRISGKTLYFTNTDRAIVGKVAIKDDGSAGDVTILAERLVADDLAIGEDGSLFLTNHIYNTLIRLSPTGQRIVIAGPDEGMPGCTSTVFGRTAETSQSLFVTTTGGILAPFEGKVREAMIVRVDIGVSAARTGFGGSL